MGGWFVGSGVPGRAFEAGSGGGARGPGGRGGAGCGWRGGTVAGGRGVVVGASRGFWRLSVVTAGLGDGDV